jgi:hypothetical protein
MIYFNTNINLCLEVMTRVAKRMEKYVLTMQKQRYDRFLKKTCLNIFNPEYYFMHMMILNLFSTKIIKRSIFKTEQT